MMSQPVLSRTMTAFTANSFRQFHLEILAILHTISALFTNAMQHKGNPLVRVDVWLYLAAALFFAVLAPFRSRWRDLRRWPPLPAPPLTRPKPP